MNTPRSNFVRKEIVFTLLLLPARREVIRFRGLERYARVYLCKILTFTGTLFLTGLPDPAQGATETWDGGGGDNNFGTGANWLDNSQPNVNDDLIFDGSVRLTPNSNYGNYDQFGAVTFAAGAGAFTIIGNPIGFTGAITNNSANLQTIQTNDMAFRNSASVYAVAGDFRFSANNFYMDIGNLNVTTAAGKIVTFNGNLQAGGGAPSGGSSVTYDGSGTTVLTQNAGYNKGTIVNGGTVRFVNSKTTGSNNYSIATGAILEFNVTTGNIVQLDNGGGFTGAGTFVKSGSGQMLLGAGNSSINNGVVAMSLSVGGMIDVQGGTLRNDYGRNNWVNNKASMNVAAGAFVDTWDDQSGVIVDSLTGAGTVQHTNYNTGGSQVTNNLTVGVANGSGIFSGTLTDADGGGGGAGQQHFLGLIKIGTGTQTLTGTTNTNRGVTTISAGTLQVGNGTTDGRLSNASNVTNNAILAFNILGTQSYSGAISGSGVVNKLGAGTQTLAGANNYTGATMISGGTLEVTGSLSATSGVTVSNTGKIQFGAAGDKVANGAGVILNGGSMLATRGFSEGTVPTGAGGAGGAVGLGALTLSPNSTIDFGVGQNGSALVFNAANTFTPGDFINIRNWSGVVGSFGGPGDNGSATNDRLLFLNDPNFSMAQLSTIRFFDDANVFLGSAREIQFNGYTEFVPEEIPEPSTMFTAALLAGVVGWRERRKEQERRRAVRSGQV